MGRKKLGAAFLVAVLSVASPGAAQASGPESTTGDMTPENVLSGAFFGTGPLIDDDLRVVVPEEVTQEEYDAMVDETVASVIEAAPAEVEDITADLTSGSPIRVDQGLEEGTELILDVWGEASLDQDVVEPQCGFAAFCVAISGFVFQNAALATTVAVASQALAFSVGVGSTEDPLEYEQAVALLAEQLEA